MKKIKKWIKIIKIKYSDYVIQKKIDGFKKTVCCCGDNIHLFGNPEISFPQNLSLGNNCKINSEVYINARSGVCIGDDVTLSHGAKIISTGYDIDHWMSSGEKIHTTNTPITIGNNCWIGANAIILPGVEITGEYVIIGAGAVVTKSITESNVLVAGNPANIVKHYAKTNQE